MRPIARWRPYLYFLILLPCLTYTLFYTARAIRLDYTPVPFWDNWRCVQYVDQLVSFDLRHFWVQHNDHRILFQEMVFALDYIFFRGVELLPIACNIACQAVQLGILWWVLRQMKQIPAAFRLTFGLCCGVFMASAIQVQVILSPFLLQWYLSQTAAALAFLFLWLSARNGRWAALAACAGAAVVVTYSTGNGMLLWPLLVTAALMLRLPRGRIAGLVIAGVVSIAAYFVGYTFMGQGRAVVFLGHPFYAVWFTAVFLGTPISYASTALGGLVGLGGLALVLTAVAIGHRRGRFADPALVVTSGVCVYIACSALMIAYGRMDPADGAVSAAQAERYASVPMTYWANLVVVVGWLSGVARKAETRRGAPAPARHMMSHLPLHIAAATLTLVTLVAVMGRQKACERAFAAEQARGHETGIALVTGVQDPDLIHVIFPDAGFIRDVTPDIRRRHLSIFAAGHQEWIGQPLSRLFQVGSLDLCSGSVEQVASIKGGYRAEGWALDKVTDRPARDVVLTNLSGTISGIGETRPGGYPHGTTDHTRRPPSDLDWTGFARAEGTSGHFQAYAIVGGGKIACALGKPREVVEPKPVDAGHVGAPIHIPEWKADPSWTVNGYHSSVGTLPGEILYGSYSGNDANQGALTSAPFDRNGQDCIALPVAHGPSAVGQSVRVVEAASGKTVGVIPLDGTGGNWQYWSIDVHDAPELRIAAEDAGGQWGQWVAVGEPHWCKP